MKQKIPHREERFFTWTKRKRISPSALGGGWI